MNGWLSKALFVIGLAFFVQGGLSLELFNLRSRREMPDKPDYAAMELVVAEMRTGSLVGSVTGSLFGCLGSWLLLLYLKTRKLENEIVELRSQARTSSTSGLSECAHEGQS